MTQVQLADRAGVSQGLITKYETTPNTKYRAAELYRIAAALETSPEYLLHGTGPKNLSDLTGTAEELKQAAAALDADQIAILISLAKSLRQK